MSYFQGESNAIFGGPPARPASHEDTRRRADSEGAEGPELAASILDKINNKLPPGSDKEEAIARKHNCQSVWCPICYRKFHLKRHYDRLREIPWNEARFVTLTLDRNKVGVGADAYIWLREKKALGRFFVNLGRHGVEVKDWAGQIEFHKDGTPHFHLLIRTMDGFKGQIGYEKLKMAWPWGGFKERYFKNKYDYHAIIGYFGKAGYFEQGKEYQTILPDYFKSEYFRGKKIIRFYTARKKGNGGSGTKTNKESDPESGTIPGYRMESCGRYTIIYYYRDDDDVFPKSELKFLERLPIPYKEFRQLTVGDYVDCVGYRFYLSGKYPVIEVPF